MILVFCNPWLTANDDSQFHFEKFRKRKMEVTPRIFHDKDDRMLRTLQPEEAK